MLKGMNLSDEQVDAIIEEHASAKDSLKQKISQLEHKLEENGDYQKKYEKLADEVKSDNWKEKFDKVNDEFKSFKNSIEKAKCEEKKRDAYRKLLKDSNVSDKQISAILKVTKFDDLKLDEDGKFVDQDKILDNIKDEWSGFIVNTQVDGIQTEKPLANKSTMTKKDIMSIKDPVERQSQIANHLELFT
jgi:hypothetical protein